MAVEIEQLKQLTTATWDRNLLSKDVRERLVEGGYAQQADSWNWIAETGIPVLVDLGFLRPRPQPVVGG